MQDIGIVWDNDFFEGDVEYSNGDLTNENGLKTAVLMSLFTDKRVSIEEALPDVNSNDRKGWWGDQAAQNGDIIGSKIWLLRRSKATLENVIKMQSYIKDCLQWMLDDGVAAKIDVAVERIKRLDNSYTLFSLIKIYQSNGSIIEMKFDDLWKAQVGL